MLYDGEQYCSYQPACILNKIIDEKDLIIRQPNLNEVYVTDDDEFYLDKVVSSVRTYTVQKAIDIIRNHLKIFIGLDYEYDSDVHEYYFYCKITTLDTNEYVTTIGAFSPEDAQESAVITALLYYCRKNEILISF